MIVQEISLVIFRRRRIKEVKCLQMHNTFFGCLLSSSVGYDWFGLGLIDHVLQPFFLGCFLLICLDWAGLDWVGWIGLTGLCMMVEAISIAVTVT